MPLTFVSKVTEECNLRCDYCWAGETNPRSMNLETARKLIERFLETSEKKGILFGLVENPF